MKKKILLFLCASIISLLVGCSNSGSKAEKYAKDFLEQFKEENFYEMSLMSNYYADELIYEYVGINIIDYSVKSIDEYKVKHTIEIHKGDLLDDEAETEYFNSRKKHNTLCYPDYNVLIDDETNWVIQSEEDVLPEYIIKFDVEYSDLVGDVKRNSVALTITQKEPESDKFVVSEMIGIVNPYSTKE